MGRRFLLRQLLVKVLAVVYKVPHRRLAARLGMSESRFSKQLGAADSDLPAETVDQLLPALQARPAVVPVVTGCLESLQTLAQRRDLTDADGLEVETAVLDVSRTVREAFLRFLQRARAKPLPGYPLPADLDAHRFRASRQLERLRRVPVDIRQELVEDFPQLHTWALCERVCEEAVRQAARDIEESLSWARLAQEIAHRVEAPQGWRARLKGYAAAHVANSFRVRGDLKPAEIVLDEAKREWGSGTDPNRVLDPGRLLDLEASLRRAQRRFKEALSLLNQAVAVSRNPGRVLIKKGFTLEVLGEYEQAVQALLQASSLVEDDRRLRSILRLNLANNFCHLARFQEAAALVTEVRPLIAEMGDKLDLVRIRGLEGRIAAGLGRPSQALPLLAEARQKFAAERMYYDVALLLLEEAVLLLKLGQNSRVKVLASELTVVFESKGIHREALAALRVFQQAAESERASEELARDLLRYLLQARHDQGLRFQMP